MRPEDIDLIVNTHSHFDHCSNNHLFPQATVIFGRNVLSPKKWDVVKEVRIPGVIIISTPGHYPDHQSVVVHSDQVYVIAGDAVRETTIRDEQRWQMVANPEYVQSVKRIFAMADVIIPGHGPIIQGEVLCELHRILATR